VANIYYDRDIDESILNGKIIGIIGYGNQGRAQAMNMRDSGFSGVIVGNRDDEYLKTAKQDGFETYSIKEACQKADILFVLIPDEVAPVIYRDKIEPYLRKGKVLNFASGYNITFGLISPPADVDVIMVAPRMIGEGVRETYLKGEGFPSFIAVEQNASGDAKDLALAIAKVIGSTKQGAIEVTFKDETYLDLIAEQATWPLILSVLTEVYDFERELGVPEEAILMELYLSKEPAVMLEKMAETGLFKQLPLHSHTSQYGQLTRFKMVDKGYIRRFIESQFRKIESGEFAREWKTEQEKGLKVFKELVSEVFDCPISCGESRLKERLQGPGAE